MSDHMGSGMSEQEWKEWEKWALSKAYSDPASAQHDLLKARNDIVWMQANLSGCDWCCGGGSDELGRARIRRDHAEAYLKSIGEEPAAAPRICLDCGHYEAADNSDECSRCIMVRKEWCADAHHADNLRRLINHNG